MRVRRDRRRDAVGSIDCFTTPEDPKGDRFGARRNRRTTRLLLHQQGCDGEAQETDIEPVSRVDVPSANSGMREGRPSAVSKLLLTTVETTMKTVQVYDKPMCCSTGVCGPEVDPVLPQFASDLDWLKAQGHNVERYNLAQQPQAFIENKTIHQVLSTEGTESLPVIVIDGEIVSRKVYPTRDVLSAMVSGSPAKQLLPVAKANSGCCGSTGCC